MSDIKSLNSKRSNTDLNLKETPKESIIEEKLDELITKHNDFFDKQQEVNSDLYEKISKLEEIIKDQNLLITKLDKVKDNSDVFRELIKEKMGL